MSENFHFYVVATPIGNLEDITFRAVRLLKDADFIACEDTRMTKQLLQHYGITHKSLLALHAHNEKTMTATILKRLQNGEKGVLVCDAGTPGLSDPGAILLDTIHQEGGRVIPVPGPSAVMTALSAYPFSRFLFYGFLPSKRGDRLKALEALKYCPYALVFYEAPHRIVDLFVDLIETFGADTMAILAKELTKVHETIVKNNLEKLLAWLQADDKHQKGEFVVIVEPVEQMSDNRTGEKALAILMQHLPLKKAAAVAATLSGDSKNRLYEKALQWQKSCE
jgi:16S rRNA (cytidine1402-2'-O)-methyltransferase